MPENTSLTPTGHIPVLMDAVMTYLNPQPGTLYVDATLGGGGHAAEILRRIQPDGVLIGIDQDRAILTETCQRLEPWGKAFRPVHGNYAHLPQHLTQQGFEQITGGVLADLGVSSFQLDRGERGFSFSKAAPLDMRMDPDHNDRTAADVVNTYREADLVRIFSEYGEERFSKTIARHLVEARKKRLIQTTTELAEIISGIYRKMPGGPQGKFRIHPATRVFQALRIEVNDELGQLQRFLDSLPEVLAPGARAVVISFHSLEDRLVKRAFRNLSRDTESHPPLLKVLTPKPIEANDAEIAANPRARSARLRAAERL